MDNEVNQEVETITATETAVSAARPSEVSGMDFVWASFVPTSVSKLFVLYFGINYANYPGEGYGIGLAISIAFTVLMLARFVWKYRNYQD